MEGVVCGVFDEKFLINFMLPSNTFSVADLLLADKLSSGHDSHCLRTDTEQTENPEIVRYCSDHEDDLFEIYSQRRRSTFHSDVILRSEDDERAYDVVVDAIIIALSPILKEGLDMTIFGDECHGQGTNLDLFDSPNWLDGNERTSVNEQFNLTGDEKSAVSYDGDRNSHSNSLEFDEFVPSDMLARLSINPEEDDRCFEVMNDERKQIQSRRSKMKQTTVTFYYDSDQEINDQSYSSSQGGSVPSSRSSRYSKIRVRNALALIVKDCESNQRSRSNKSNGTSAASLKWSHSTSRADAITVDAKLEGWISRVRAIFHILHLVLSSRQF